MSPRLAFALEAATEGGRSTLAHFQTNLAIESKADSSPVTIADRQAEQMIRRMIETRFPGEAILGEEEGGSQTPNRWVIDPIDGTKSFIAGVPLYATLLSYEQDGQPILGVAYFPALNELFYAERSFGAFLNGRPCRVSQQKVIEGSTISCGGHRSMRRYDRWEGFASLADQALVTRTWCDAYGHALVAAGRIDAMVDPIVSRWDLSALKIIVQEAGGVFTDFVGDDPFAKGDHDLEAISTNGLVHPEVLAAYRQ
jgi:histidinol phosphatase-like enzyme (inositol monophosphatase family)